jgi:acyl transferase domain-containing protein
LIAEGLGWNGKAIVVDGNCTGGLIALELAAGEVERGAPFAVAGALSYVDAANQVIYSNARLLSRHGCFPFADDSSGTVVSDGVTLFILSTIERAEALGLPVYGIVRAVAGANDGGSEGYMLIPNPRGHMLAIDRAHLRAQVRPSQIDLFIAHGSATRAGDGIETFVLDSCMRSGGADPEAPPVPVASIKGNIGHTKEAAGLANLAALLALFEAEKICAPVRSQGSRTSFENRTRITVSWNERAWKQRCSPRIAGVSAVASGGQNYHAVIEAPASARSTTTPQGHMPSRAEAGAEPIAIVGLAGTFAGAANVDAYWGNLLAGRSSFLGRPPSRPWSLLFDEERASSEWAGENPFIYTNWGAPLALDVVQWTRRADRYGEGPSNILRYDPLHFLLVDLARSAAEGYDFTADSNVAVVVGADHCSSFGLRQVMAARLPEIERHLAEAIRATGRQPKDVDRTVRATMRALAADLPELSSSSLFNISQSFLAARIARAFDLTGPICAIEAGGAASSFAALEVACGRLADHEVDAAFWATADMRLGALRYTDECSLGYLSRGNRPTAFCESSDGYLPGEGASVFLLRRLTDARRRGDHVHGIIRGIGSAIQPPSKASPLMSATAMAEAIRRANRQADISPDQLGFLECFGCGLPSSDEAELEALGDLIAKRAHPLVIGSVMPNIGHTGAAAGAASLIKALFALREGVLPATLGMTGATFASRNHHRVPTRPVTIGRARFAGINAAGPGGVHYHVLVEAGDDAAAAGP